MSSPDAQETTIAPLREVARKHRFALLTTYSLFGLETVAGVAQPFSLGLAIDGLLAGSKFGLMIFAGQQLCVLVVGSIRRVYDTRLFTRIASDLASRLVIDQRQVGVAVSQVSARAVLSRQLVDFFERDLPFVFYCAVQGVGALVMLALAAPTLLPYCLVSLVAASVLGLAYGHFAQRWNQNLHDELERTVGLVTEGREAEVKDHYRQLAQWQVYLSDGEALFFGFWQGLTLVLTGLVIVQCSNDIKNAGQIVAVLGYLQMLLTTLVNVPRIADQITRLYDICRRMRPDPTPEPGPAKTFVLPGAK